MKLKFFHIPKPRQFDVPPRFHDPEQEERDLRERRIKQELGMTSEEEKMNYAAGIKGQMRRGAKGLTIASQHRRKSNTRVVVIALILAGLLYFFLNF
ncbi:hypothetical protein EMN47_06070 [Prolixibacteraceae bacterium JC049]|nr:hypothetical protein [Prolixibacteraceae bacterium JC049]